MIPTSGKILNDEGNSVCVSSVWSCLGWSWAADYDMKWCKTLLMDVQHNCALNA